MSCEMDFCCLIYMHVHLEYRFACYRVCDLLWTCLVILVSLVVDLVWFVELWWYLCTICVICGLVWWYMWYLRHLCDICDIWAICVICEVFDLQELKLKTKIKLNFRQLCRVFWLKHSANRPFAECFGQNTRQIWVPSAITFALALLEALPSVGILALGKSGWSLCRVARFGHTAKGRGLPWA